MDRFPRERLPRRTKAETSSAERPCPLCGKLVNVKLIEKHADRCAGQKFPEETNFGTSRLLGLRDYRNLLLSSFLSRKSCPEEETQ